MISAWLLAVIIPIVFIMGFCLCAMFSMDKEDDNANV
jgi:hypothetical protein